jgi:GTP-binding protein HflX
MTLLVPFQDGGVITKLHALNAVRETEYVAEGTRLLVSLPLSEKDRFISYQIKE